MSKLFLIKHPKCTSHSLLHSTTYLKSSIRLFACLSVLLVCAITAEDAWSQSTGTTYYVNSTNGDDKNSGLSETNAFATLQYASDQTHPGDTVLVMNGTYSAFRTVLKIERSGRADAWITYQAYPGHKPLIQNNNWWHTVKIDANYIIFDGFAVRGVKDDFTLEEATAHFEAYATGEVPKDDPPNPGLFGSGIRANAHTIIRNNEVYKHGASGLGAWIDGDYLIIENNLVYENAWYTAFGESGINLWQIASTGPVQPGLEGSKYKIIVRNNISHSNYNFFPCRCNDYERVTDGNGIILDLFSNLNTEHPPYNGWVLVENNLLFNNGGAGVVTVEIERADIVHNVAYHNGQHPALTGEIYGVYSGSDVNFINNILVAGPEEKVTKNNGHEMALLNFDYNIYFAEGATPILEGGIGPNDIITDPRFALPGLDHTVADFRLVTGSPGIDSGSDDWLPSVDLSNSPRPAEAVNRGLYEAVATAIQPHTMIDVTSATPTVDGQVDALWQDVPSLPLRHTLDGGLIPPADSSGLFRAVWKDGWLYVLVEVQDNLLTRDSAEEWWHDDGVEIYIDGNHSRGVSYDGVDDYQLIFRWDEDAVIAGVNSAPVPSNLDYEMIATADGYRLEAALPLAAMGLVPMDGTRLGLDVQLFDDDNGGGRESKLAWHSYIDETWRNPSYFGMAQLRGRSDSILMIDVASATPTVDGQVDALWQNVPALPLRHTLEGGFTPPADSSGLFRAVWEDGWLYVLVEVQDDLLIRDSVEEWWHDDGVEIYIDGNHSRGTSYDGVDDYQLIFRWDEDTVIAGNNSAPVPSNLDYEMIATADGYRLEVALPLAAMGMAPMGGTRLGFDVQLFDDDNGGERESKLAWHSHIDETWRNPSYFGMAQLRRQTDSTFLPIIHQ